MPTDWECSRLLKILKRLCLDEDTSMLTIPVLIDSIKTDSEFWRTRAVYLRIENRIGPVTWPKSVRHGAVLLAAWGDWAVLVSPGRDAWNNPDGLFSSAEVISKTIADIESIEGHIVDLGNLWIPNDVLGFENKYSEYRSGDVYRISPDIFRDCFRFGAGMISESEWRESCRENRKSVLPSKVETEAFRAWRREQIDRSRTRYHSEEYADYRLPKKGGSSELF